MTNKKLKTDLLKKLGITPQGLSQRVKVIKKTQPMTTEEAVYIIAHKEDLQLDKYLEAETIEKIRGLMQQLSIAKPPTIPRTIKVKNTKKVHRYIVIPNEFRGSDPVLPRKKILEAREMASLYPLLYVLENSIREVIDRKMVSSHGNSWWRKIANKSLKDKVTKRMKDDEKNSWHQRRGSNPIDYLDLNELPILMRKIEHDIVPDILPTFEWFNQLINEVYKSRCVICHMNPLDKDNMQSLRLKFRQWQKQINQKKDLL